MRESPVLKFLPHITTIYDCRMAEILRVMRIARENGLLTMLHAENGDMIELLVKEALENKHTYPDLACQNTASLGG